MYIFVCPISFFIQKKIECVAQERSATLITTFIISFDITVNHIGAPEKQYKAGIEDWTHEESLMPYLLSLVAIKAYKLGEAGIYTCHKLLIMLDTECKGVWVVQCPLQQMDKYDNLNDKIFFLLL